MTATATKPAPEPASALTEAEAEQEQARSEAAAITAKVAELTRSGPGFDQGLHARLKVEQESALKALRAADLQLEEQKAAATAPISARVIDKIRAMRRRVADSRSALLTRQAEANHLRGHLQGVRNSIAALEASSEFKRDHQGVMSSFVWGKDAKGPGDHRTPAAVLVDSPQSIKQLAKLERDLTITTTELQIAQAAQSEAQTCWESAKGTLDSWQETVRALGPVARRALAGIPDAGVFDNQGFNPGSADIEIGRGKYSTRGMAS